jgi:hypothetical protein
MTSPRDHRAQRAQIIAERRARLESLLLRASPEEAVKLKKALTTLKKRVTSQLRYVEKARLHRSQMVVTPWTCDEFGNPSRCVYATETEAVHDQT